MWCVDFFLFNALLFLFCFALPLQIVLTFILRSNQYAHAQKATLKKKLPVLNLSLSLFPAECVREK